MLCKSAVSRAAVVGVMVLVGGVVLGGPAQALKGDDNQVSYDVEKWVTLDGPVSSEPAGRGDWFLNFDANWDEDGAGDDDQDGGPENSSAWVDWPVNLVFVSDDPTIISTSKVKAVVDNDFPAVGGPMHALLHYSSGGEWYDEWDIDRGRKMFPSTCGENGSGFDYNYHYRIYGPLGESTLYHPDYGNFVIASSHIDYREGCEGDHWSGRSESAEAYIAGVFRQHGKWVEEDKIPLGNAIDTADDPEVSDGYATVVHLDRAPPTGDDPNAPGNPGDQPAAVDAGPDVNGAEGAPIELRGTASDNGTLSSVQWSYAAGSDVDAGAACTFADASAPVTSIRCTDDGTFTVTLSADDGYQAVPSTDSAVVHVSNVAPSIGIAGPRPWQVFRVGDPVTVSVNVTDPGGNDTHTAVTAWDDGTTSTGSASGQTHTFAHAGMYTIRSTVTDDDGGRSAPASVMVVVYDPNGPWANADGSYLSTAGALTGSPDIAGEAWFHLAGKYYPQDPATPLGTARTWLPGSDYRFDTDDSALEWLVVTPDGKVAARGSGTLAGHEGRYGFVFYAYDGCAAGGTAGACTSGADRFRAVVWSLSAAPNPGTGTVYDNQSGTSYDLDEATPVPIKSGAVLIQQPS